jgi:hypothetical protein
MASGERRCPDAAPPGKGAASRWRLIGLIGLMAAAFGIPAALSVTAAPFDLRIGAGFADLPGVKLFSAPQPGLQYQVLSERGATLFLGAVREQVEDDLCTGEKQTAWYVSPPERQLLQGLDAAVIVLGARSPIDLRPLPGGPPTEDDQARLADYLQNLAANKPNQRVEHTLHDLGRKAETRRVAVVFAAADEQSDPVSGFEGIRVAIVDITGEQVVERYQYGIESGEAGELIARVAAVADLDQDGLGDTVLVDFGDFYDKVLLIEESPQWRVQTDDWGDPC